MSMYRLSALVSTLLFANPIVWITLPAQAQVQLAEATEKRVQFTPGDRIRVQVINLTYSLVQLEQVQNTDPIPLSPGRQLEFLRGGSTDPNISIVFWDETGLPVRAKIQKRDRNILRIELLPWGKAPGDRSVYVQDDGTVTVY